MSSYSRLPTGPYILPALDEFVVTFKDHTMVDLGFINMKQLVNYLGNGDVKQDCLDKWPPFYQDYDNKVLKIHQTKPNIKFVINEPYYDGWTVEFVDKD